MTLQEFKSAIVKDAEEFVKTWEAGKNHNPEQYPLELPEGDWYDQFLAYLNLNQ